VGATREVGAACRVRVFDVVAAANVVVEVSSLAAAEAKIAVGERSAAAYERRYRHRYIALTELRPPPQGPETSTRKASSSGAKTPAW